MTGAHLAYAFAKYNRKCQLGLKGPLSNRCVLYCAPSNKAVDVVLGKQALLTAHHLSATTYIHTHIHAYIHRYRMARNFVRKIFGGLLKICHLVEFTLAVESVLAIMIFIAQWLIEHTGNLTGPLGSFRSVRTKSMIKCNSKLNKSLLPYSGLFSSHRSLQ